MFNFGDYISIIAMVVTSLWIVHRFWGTFFEKKGFSFGTLIAWILFFISQVYSQRDIGTPHVSTIFITFFLVLNIAIWGYYSGGKEKYFLLVLFCAVWVLLEVFAFILVSGISMEYESRNFLGAIISKLLMVVSVYIISVFWNRRHDEAIPGHFYLCFLLLPAGSIFVALSLFYSKGSILLSTVSVSVLLLFNVVVFELYIKMNELYMQEKEKIVYAKQLDIISANTEEQKKMIEDFHEEKHNLVNQLIVLKNEVESCKTEEVIKNLNQIINNCDYTERLSNCGNSTIDAIINFKYAVAKEHGIDFHLKILVPEDLPIEQRDIGVVLGNSLDNAIEAVMECDKKEKVIDISMGTKKSAWILVIKNFFEHEIERDRRGRIVSSKKEKDKHGYGLKSIMKIAAKYQGDVLIDDEENVFSLTVVLNFGEI